MKKGAQPGRSLLELLVAMGIGALLVAVLGQLYLSTSAASRQTSALARLNEDAVVLLKTLATQLRMAGFSLPRLHAAPARALVDGEWVSVSDRHFMGAACAVAITALKIHRQPASMPCAAPPIRRARPRWRCALKASPTAHRRRCTTA